MQIHLLDDLTGHERKVVDSARRGSECACSDLSVDDLAGNTDPELSIRAEVIRELLLGRRGELDPRGIRVRGAQIVGDLDLSYVYAVVGLELVECVITERVTAEWARLPRLVLRGSVITMMHADGLRTEGELVLEHVRSSGTSERGTIRLMDAHIGGELDCDDAEITNDSGPALSADRLQVGSNLSARRLRASGVGENGALRLLDAHVGGQFSCNDAKLVNDSGPSLITERIRVDGSLWLERVQAKGAGRNGAMRLLGAHVGGQFGCDRTEITNHSGPALVADGLHVDKDLFILRTRADAAGEDGAIRISGAHVGGQLGCDRTEITNHSGPALVADGLHVDKDLFLRQIRARGMGKRGVVRLIGAHVGGYLACDDAEITNDCGPALYADRLQVEGNLSLQRMHANGTGALGTIRLLNARIGGQFNCDGTNVQNPSGIALTVQGAGVGAEVVLPATVICPEPRSCSSYAHTRHIDLDGFTFRALGHVNWTQWLHLVRHHTQDYRPQPYQQLAAAERSAGHDGNARRILIDQQDDLRNRAPRDLGNRFFQLAHCLWGRLTGYGYRARRTALALLLALAAAGTVGYVAGQVDTRPGHHAAERAAPPGIPTTAGAACSTVELVGLGLDRGLPLGPTGLRGSCAPDTTTRRGQGFAIVIWIIQAIVWALAVLALAGYTSLIRKPA
ncbi:hypothetical protein ACIA8G_21570 [Lentzea sp. NPDC051213]|uniref:hypothetical protein n=1 Tax=Lentzea sp. NPDC051213 TaxID=3364126 RepID=UPI00379BC5DF